MIKIKIDENTILEDTGMIIVESEILKRIYNKIEKNNPINFRNYIFEGHTKVRYLPDNIKAIIKAINILQDELKNWINHAEGEIIK